MHTKKSSKKTWLSILIASALTGCAGDDELREVKMYVTPEGQEIVISVSNQNVSKAPSAGDTVIVTGSNNNISLLKKPKYLDIKGNDNQISIIHGTNYDNRGRGNVITISK